jgi:hypothetical protein
MTATVKVPDAPEIYQKLLLWTRLMVATASILLLLGVYLIARTMGMLEELVYELQPRKESVIRDIVRMKREIGEQRLP